MSGNAESNMLRARFKSLKTHPVSGEDAIRSPYFCSHSFTCARKRSRSAGVSMDITCRNSLRRCLASVRLGLIRHHISPWRWIWTKQRWIMILGQSLRKTLIRCWFPSTVALFGDNSRFANETQNLKRSDGPSETSGSPYNTEWLSASITAKIPRRCLRMVPSKIRYRYAERTWVLQGGWSNQYSIIRLMVEMLCPLWIDSCRMV